MQPLVVDDKQAEVIRTAPRKIEVRDPTGRIIGYITRAPTKEEIAKARKRFEEGECRISP